MKRKRIAVACQGGGSQCAFVAGALKALLADGSRTRYELVGLSGTSGGALTAALGWISLLLKAHGDPTPLGDRIVACWKDLSAQTPQEILFDAVSTQLLRLVEAGLLPSVASSPSSLGFRLGTKAAAQLLRRREFTDFPALLRKHIDFDALPSLVRPDSPVLLVGAGDVIEGTFKIFSSAHGEINAESIWASAAIPNLFPAVWVDGHAYWDGIFASNPPVFGFLQPALMGKVAPPDEIWVIQVNRTRLERVPERPSDILDRRNQLAGNLSLRHELKLLEMVNFMLKERALSDEFRSRFGLQLTEAIGVRFIRMSEKLAQSLDYPSKLSRQPTHIDRLLADGEAQATRFLNELAEADRPKQEAPRVEHP